MENIEHLTDGISDAGFSYRYLDETLLVNQTGNPENLAIPFTINRVPWNRNGIYDLSGQRYERCVAMHPSNFEALDLNKDAFLSFLIPNNPAPHFFRVFFTFTGIPNDPNQRLGSFMGYIKIDTKIQRVRFNDDTDDNYLVVDRGNPHNGEISIPIPPNSTTLTLCVNNFWQNYRQIGAAMAGDHATWINARFEFNEGV